MNNKENHHEFGVSQQHQTSQDSYQSKIIMRNLYQMKTNSASKSNAN